MKTVILSLFMFNQYSAVAQTDTGSSKRDKPSWSSKMPDREDVPKLEHDENDSEIDMGSLTLDRDALFNNEDDEQEQQPALTDNVIVEDNNSPTNPIRNRQTEEDLILEQQRIAEQRKVAEKQRELQAQKAAEQQKIEQRLAEQARLEELEKIAEEKKAADAKRALEEQQTDMLVDEALQPVEAATEVLAEEEPQQQSEETPVVALDDSKAENAVVTEVKYTWKRTKNVLPEYPTKAAQYNREGWVDVEFTIDSAGNVIGARSVKTYKNSKMFIKAALKAVRKWKYQAPSDFGIFRNQTNVVRVVFNLAD